MCIRDRTCTQGHAHEEHRHADGAVCTGDHELEGHQHAEGEACTGDHEREESAEKNSSQPGDMIPVHVDEKARHSLDMRFEKVEETSHGAAKTLHGQMVIPPDVYKRQGMRSGVKYRALDWVAGSTCSATLREPFSSSVFLPLVRVSRAFA